MNDYFRYGARETAYLKKADKRLGEVIDRIGEIKRETIGDLFAAIVHSIVGQQISTKAHRTVWQRICAALGTVTPQTVLSISAEELKNLGISFRKAEYIRSAAQKVASEELDLEALYAMSDDEVRSRLTQLRGIGVWSAEMLMLFFHAAARHFELRRFGHTSRPENDLSSSHAYPEAVREIPQTLLPFRQRGQPVHMGGSWRSYRRNERLQTQTHLR